MNDFLTLAGVIDFDPEQREANGKTVTQFTIIAPGQKKVRVTIWPELKLPEGLLQKGLLVGVRGKYSTSTGKDGTEYHNLSAYSVGVGDKVFTKEEAGVVKKAAPSEPAF